RGRSGTGRGSELERGAFGDVRRRNPRVPDVLLESRRPRTGRHTTDRRTAVEDRPEIVQRALVRHPCTPHVDADELPVDALVRDPREGPLADKLWLLIDSAVLPQPGDGERGAAGDAKARPELKEAALDPRAPRRRDRGDPVRSARPLHPPP